MTYPQTGGFPPPKKSSPTVIVGIVAVVVLALGALGITGFVTPGFFLPAENAGTPATSAPRDLTSPPEVMLDFVAKLNSRDVDGADSLYCTPDSERPVIEEAIERTVNVELDATIPGSGTDEVSHLSKLTGSIDGRPGEWIGNLVASKSANHATTWCITLLVLGRAAPPSYEPEDLDEVPIPEVVHDVVRKINAGDADGAKRLHCKGSSVDGVDLQVEKHAKISVGDWTGPQSSDMHNLQLTGSIDGISGKREKTTGELKIFKALQSNPDWCIGSVIFSPR